MLLCQFIWPKHLSKKFLLGGRQGAFNLTSQGRKCSHYLHTIISYFWYFWISLFLATVLQIGPFSISGEDYGSAGREVWVVEFKIEWDVKNHLDGFRAVRVPRRQTCDAGDRFVHADGSVVYEQKISWRRVTNLSKWNFITSLWATMTIMSGNNGWWGSQFQPKPTIKWY